MFAVTVTFRIKPGKLQEFLPLMHDNAATSLAEEAGCRVFDVCTDPARPDDVFLYELYASQQAFQDHLQTAHFREFDVAVAPLIVDKAVATYTEVTR